MTILNPSDRPSAYVAGLISRQDAKAGQNAEWTLQRNLAGYIQQVAQQLLVLGLRLGHLRFGQGQSSRFFFLAGTQSQALPLQEIATRQTSIASDKQKIQRACVRPSLVFGMTKKWTGACRGFVSLNSLQEVRRRKWKRRGPGG